MTRTKETLLNSTGSVAKGQSGIGDKVLRIATRESPLAMWQAEHVAKLLAESGFETELVPLVSHGDVDMRPIDGTGRGITGRDSSGRDSSGRDGTGQVGVFTKRIQQALLDDEADIAVHSLKDLPTDVDTRLILSAVTARDTVNDSLVSRTGWTLEQLPESARVGTGSRRRAAQLLLARPDLKILPIRGNVQTRMKKLIEGQFDAIMLAEAGLVRLGMSDVKRCRLSLDQMLPAPGQAALGIETRRTDSDSAQAVAELDDAKTRAAVTAERTLLADLHGGCLAPIAAYAEVDAGASTICLQALVAATDGSKRLDAKIEGPFDANHPIKSGQELGRLAAADLIDQGAKNLIESAR